MEIETDVNSVSDDVLDKDGILGHQVFLVLLLGLSKGNTRVEISAYYFFSFSHSLQVLNTHARQFDSDEQKAWCNGGRRKVYAVEDQHTYCV